MPAYDHKTEEAKWQKRWAAARAFAAQDNAKKEKRYLLVEFPYPSGEGLHVGHTRTYTAMDIVARKNRLQGANVLFPIGFDAFGLPAENYAVKTGKQPANITTSNIKRFSQQLKSLGFSFDWDRTFSTTDPDYYRWTQWIFLKVFEKGLAYKATIPINWCLSCKIGLANEEVVNGVCERCGGQVEKRQKEQWMFKITAYADRLLADLEKVNYLERIKAQQINWIGRKEWIDIRYQVDGTNEEITVSTTRPDTNFGATFVVLAPEHPLLSPQKGLIHKKHRAAVDAYIVEAKKKSDLERMTESRKKTGVFTGLYCVNNLNGAKLPIWVTDFVLMDVGTGAVVGVPGHDLRDFEFAQEFGLPVIRVVIGKDGDASSITRREQVQEDEGTMINSGFLDGMDIHKAISAVMDHLEKKNWGKRVIRYHLRDWVFSRQRYWGEPIPIVYCASCWEKRTAKQKPAAQEGVDFVRLAGKEHAVVPLPEDQLPLKLPAVEKYEPTDSGESPLAAIVDWVNTTCPKCGSTARRETDTMPNWAGSNWYFLRYCDPRNDKKLIDHKLAKYWLPVDWYNGGMEHTTLHLLYSRFIYKVLWDIGAIPKECGSEPYAKRTAHGMILGEDGEKMSKSRGNVVNPDDVTAQSGADVLRVYEMFIGPFDQAAAWDSKSILGVKRFLDRIWHLAEHFEKEFGQTKQSTAQLLHQTIKKVGCDIDDMHFNTAVSALMILANELNDQGCDQTTWEQFLVLLSPFAPHLAESCWAKSGHKKLLVEDAAWPTYDAKLTVAADVEIAIQINGKHRGTITLPVDVSAADAIKAAKAQENVARHLEGKKIVKEIFIPNRMVSLVVK